MKNPGPQSFRFFLYFVVAAFCFLEIAPDFPFTSLQSMNTLLIDGIFAFIGLFALISMIRSVAVMIGKPARRVSFVEQG
jgi:hypothetical protein